QQASGLYRQQPYPPQAAAQLFYPFGLLPETRQPSRDPGRVAAGPTESLVATLPDRAPVAQLDRASVYGTEGQRVESSRARIQGLQISTSSATTGCGARVRRSQRG